MLSHIYIDIQHGLQFDSTKWNYLASKLQKAALRCGMRETEIIVLL
jgi:hypothetical protein